MDLSQDMALQPQDSVLASLAARVGELEREVAALKLEARGTAKSSVLSGPVSGPVPFQHELEASDSAPERSVPPPAASAVLTGAASGKPLSVPLGRGRSLENRLGAQVFNRIGIAALLIAASWGLKLAFENGWIGPVGRVVIGLLAGAGLVLWSERFRKTGSASFSYSLKAVGSGVLYLTLWAGFQIYGVLPAAVALTMMVGVTAWNAFLAWSQNAELLAAYALSGAFATPLLLSTAGNHEVFLFTYLGSIDLATLLLVRVKPWPRLLLAALVGTIAFYAGWYTRFYLSFFSTEASTQPFVITVLFVVGFALLFALGSVRGFVRWTDGMLPGGEVGSDRLFARSPAILSVLVPFLNAGFLATALALLFHRQFQTDLLPWLMVALAVVYLALTRVQRSRAAAALHLALAVIFLTVAIPLKASGHTLTVAWFAEGLALLWAACITFRAPNTGEVSQLTPYLVLRVLSAAGYVLGFLAFCAMCLPSSWATGRPFLTSDLLTGLFAAACFAGAAWLCLRPATNADDTFPRVAIAAFCGLDAVALLLSLREFGRAASQPAFLNPDFATALVSLAILALAAYAMLRLSRGAAHGHLRMLASVTFVLFNLLALLSVKTEINALWHRPEANLQRSLAVSGFLMLYGAALLTAGFFQRSAFTRWQALILILFTICKVFLYDISSLSEGYRVASFLGLGVLLMAVSFAYQKDWLGLKTTPVSGPEVQP